MGVLGLSMATLYYAPILVMGLVVLSIPGGCDYQDHGTVYDIPGADFEITEEFCKIPLAATDDVIVRAIKHRGDGAKTVIFGYSPGGWYPMVPSIKQIGDRTLLISVDWVSSIGIQKEEWEGFAIKYDIGRLDYTRPTDRTRP